MWIIPLLGGDFWAQPIDILHNIIQIHDNGSRDWQYPMKYSYNHTKYGEYFAEYRLSHKRLLWIWILLCGISKSNPFQMYILRVVVFFIVICDIYSKFLLNKM